MSVRKIIFDFRASSYCAVIAFVYINYNIEHGYLDAVVERHQRRLPWIC